MTDKAIITAFEHVFTTLQDKGYKPAFNVTDNQATIPIKKFLKSQNCTWQFVEPHNHRVNAAERAIQTWKSHLISGLCTTDNNWPLQLWDKLTLQGTITLNTLRTSRIDPNKSAYHQVHGHRYDWNAHPLAPPGTRAVIYDSPHGRASWAPRGTDAWYCGPSMDHYRNCDFFVPATKAYRTSASFHLFPQHCQLPTFSPPQHAQEVCDELLETIPSLPKAPKRRILRILTRAMTTLA